ncbi:unnamed protein product [Arabis nemorensis]|uniref:Uncharacterized protein n=1 Tax=Arabis nemorensis TaxID=586526 RepID=A0A565BCP8_9BRAS|nr:unnamed protein product [Arabis nemorensis]
MDPLFEKIKSNIGTAKMNVDIAHTVQREAIDSGLEDEAFRNVTNLINKFMTETSSAAEVIDQRLQNLRRYSNSFFFVAKKRYSNSYRNFRRELDATDQLADIVLASSQLALEQMHKAVANAEEWRIRQGP